jgi:hypothetical protein
VRRGGQGPVTAERQQQVSLLREVAGRHAAGGWAVLIKTRPAHDVIASQVAVRRGLASAAYPLASLREGAGSSDRLELAGRPPRMPIHPKLFGRRLASIGLRVRRRREQCERGQQHGGNFFQ